MPARLFIALFAIFATALIATPASAQTMGDGYTILENIKSAVKQRCPESKRGDMDAMLQAMKCTGIQMPALRLLNVLGARAIKLSEQCLVDVQKGKDIKECDSSNENFRKVVLDQVEAGAYHDLSNRYAELLRNFPVIRP